MRLSFGPHSSPGTSDTSSHRVRQTVRNAVHRVSDKLHRHKDKDPSGTGGTIKGTSGSSDTSAHRVRQTARNAVHRISDKLHRHKDKGPSGTSDKSSHRVRQTVRNAVHRVSDKLHRHKDKGSSGSGGNIGGNRGTFGGSGIASADGKPSKKSQIFDKIKTAGGAAILKGVAKKIFSSKSKGGSHIGGGVRGGSHHSAFNGMHPHNRGIGYYHGYNYLPGRYSEIQGSICTNNQMYEEISFGEFQCPLEGFNYEATFCCGPPNEQYCCSEQEYKTQYTDSYLYEDLNHDDYEDYHGQDQVFHHHNFDDSKASKIVGIVTAVIGVIFLTSIPTIVLIWLCYRRLA